MSSTADAWSRKNGQEVILMIEFEKVFQKVQNGNDVRGAAIAAGKETVTITPEMAAYIADAFADHVAAAAGCPRSSLRIGIGRDSRVSGPAMSEGCIKGLENVQVCQCGLVSTPAMFQSTVMEESHFDAAIMITASHLPFNRSGMKFFTREGALTKGELGQILTAAAAKARQQGEEEDEIVYKTAQGQEPVVTDFDLADLYSRHMREFIKREVNADDYEHPLTGLHVVVDAGNGAAGFFPGKILEPLGADISGSVYLEPDGMFPNHVPNPENAEAMEAIRAAVLAAKADLGIIFDCDGDRGAVVLSDGTEVNRNTLIAMLAAIVSEKYPGSTVVTDSVTSDELAVFLEKDLGLKHLRFKRGYKNVIDKGIELNQAGQECELAIETSGHGAFRENYFSDDGAYLSVKILCKMAVMRREGKDISSLIAGLKQPAQAEEIRYDIVDDPNDPRDFKEYGSFVLDALREYALHADGMQIVEPNYEGIRIAFDDENARGWLLLRKSLHDPVMPMNVESSNEGGVQRILSRIQPFIDSCVRLK